MDAETFLTAGPTGGASDTPVIVLIHGWGASKEIWLPILHSKMAERYRLIAVDLPGVGAAKNESSDGQPKSLADLVASKISSLGVNEYTVLGHSQGANVAAWMALRHPDHVKSLVIVSGALLSNRLPSANHYLSPVYGTPLLESLRHVAGFAGWIDSRLPRTSHTNLGWARGYMRRSGYLHAFNRTPELLKQLHGLVRNPIDLAHLDPDLPILWIHGAKDSTIPLEHARESVAKCPSNSKLLIYDDALHCPMDTHMDRFIEDVEAHSARPLRPSATSPETGEARE